MTRDDIIDKYLVFDVRTKLTKSGAYTALVHNERDDGLKDLQLTFLMKNYGTPESPRFWAPRPSFLNIPIPVFDKVLASTGRELDQFVLQGKFTDTVAGGSIGRVFFEHQGISYKAIQSSGNPSNTVIYWQIIDTSSPFIGLSSQFTIVPSRDKAGGRHVVASGDVPGVKSFNRVKFFSTDKMAPVQSDNSGHESTNLSAARWVSIVNNKFDAMGYITQQSIIEAIASILQTKLSKAS